MWPSLSKTFAWCELVRFSNKVMGPHVIFPQTVGFFGILFRICHANIKCVCDDNRRSDDNRQLTLYKFNFKFKPTSVY